MRSRPVDTASLGGTGSRSQIVVTISLSLDELKSKTFRSASSR
jgi:hypothetical protein